MSPIVPTWVLVGMYTTKAMVAATQSTRSAQWPTEPWWIRAGNAPVAAVAAVIRAPPQYWRRLHGAACASSLALPSARGSTSSYALHLRGAEQPGRLDEQHDEHA